MKNSLINGWNSFLKLFRWLAWYGIGVVTIFYLLPVAGLMAEAQYDQLSSAAKFFSVIGFFLVAGAWQIMSMRDRWRDSFQTIDPMTSGVYS
jgi:hypothetical protein